MRAQKEAEVVACIPGLRRYARGLTGDAQRADDLVQDTLERAWSRFPLWRRRGELRAWMFGIMHNLFIDQVRSARDRYEVPYGDDAPTVPVRATQTDNLEVRDLDRLLQQLPPDLRAVILLVSVEEMSYAQAACVMGVAVGTIMSRLSRAREQLSARMEQRRPATGMRSVK
ncbi:RNA polymerase sigma factor [Pollutimonas bauzanensis]|uniref:RNA polymerase sigma-70 factor, ECF subfamily n=1 Tax=Pollutimonas bauzanensis TaxID=658167 RepID=A0A1M5ZFB7_9BURK|nr:RNA polymerase sigma factor [Pollutimonas bauzanensis]SHI22851.1 RNA polymerase sigma-70 factor, ECF subfamily [Pollutimonas bauzanensis]